MESSVSMNGLISSLPKIPKRMVWNVRMDGRIVQAVSATDNRESTARDYIAKKYGRVDFSLEFLEYRIGSRP